MKISLACAFAALLLLLPLPSSPSSLPLDLLPHGVSMSLAPSKMDTIAPSKAHSAPKDLVSRPLRVSRRQLYHLLVSVKLKSDRASVCTIKSKATILVCQVLYFESAFSTNLARDGLSPERHSHRRYAHSRGEDGIIDATAFRTT